MRSGIYKITNTVNGKFYIGSATDLVKRRRSHLSSLKYGRHKNEKLQRSYDKHGQHSFKFETVLYCDAKNLIMYEQIVIDGFDPVANGYNIKPIAGSTTGYRHSDETKAKMKAAWVGRVLPPPSEDRGRKISEAKTGKKRKPFTEEARRNMSLSKIGNKNRLGIPHTEETKAKMKAIREMRKQEKQNERLQKVN